MNLYHTISNELQISKTKQIPLKKFTTIMMFGIDRYVIWHHKLQDLGMFPIYKFLMMLQDKNNKA